jgi:hypothetical protein
MKTGPWVPTGELPRVVGMKTSPTRVIETVAGQLPGVQRGWCPRAGGMEICCAGPRAGTGRARILATARWRLYRWPILRPGTDVATVA